MKMICFFLKIRMSYCLRQPVTWQLNKLIQMVYTSGVILELFIEVLSHNKSLSNAAISGPALIQLTQILQMFVKAIFDGSTERTNWPSLQRNLNVKYQKVK